VTASDQTFGIYIHWPFCAQKCPYCDFNSHVRFSGWDEDRFLAAYLRELAWVASLPPPSRGEVKVSSIFFGGGTPSLMKPQTTGAILDHIAKLWPVDAQAEITLEANPGSVEAERFQGYRAAGVNRVSMGFQSLRDAELKKLGRVHTVAEAKAALAIARATFERYSFDLIYARPGQTAQQWREELAEALDLVNDHVSLYQLTIEPDTPYAALHAAGKLIVPDPDAALELYEITQEMTAAKGLAAYEISNHAKPGAESRHNLLYWRYGAYAGVGPGAHGRLFTHAPSGRFAAGESEGAKKVRVATVAEKHPETWAGKVESDGHGFTEWTPLTRTEQADEMLLMGLRLTEGVDLERLARIGGVRPSETMISDLSALGLIERTGGAPHETGVAGPRNELDEIKVCLGPGMAPEHAPDLGRARGPRIRATPRGRFVLNAVVAKLSASFQDVASPPAMDIGACGL
jgi:oxygen-independent coproporphyrinogen-3 oxidase